MRWNIALGFLMVPAVLLAPVNVAQDADAAQWSTTLDVQWLGAFVDPGGAAETARLTATVTCEQGSVWPDTNDVLATFSVDVAESWVEATIVQPSHALEFTAQECAQGDTRSLETEVEVRVGREAAFEDAAVLTGQVQVEDVTSEAQFTVIAGHYFQTVVELERGHINATAGERIELRFEVQNHGNGLLRAEAQVGEQTGGWVSVVLPGPVLVEPFGAKESAVIGLLAPDSTSSSRKDIVHVDVWTAAAMDSSVRGDDFELLAVLITTQVGGSPAEDAPGLSMALALVAMGGLVAASRLRRGHRVGSPRRPPT